MERDCASELREGELGKKKKNQKKNCIKTKHMPYYHICIHMVNIKIFVCIYVNKNKSN